MESSRSDHPSQTVNSSDRQPSQTVSCSDRQSSQTVSCSDRQLRFRGSVADEVADLAVATVAGNAAAVSGNASDFAETHNEESRQAMGGCWQWSDVGQCWIPDQPIFTATSRTLSDRNRAADGREDGWHWLKDDGGGLQSEDSCRSVESPHALGDGPTLPPPPPCQPLPPTPRYPGPPAKPIDDPTGTVVPPPPFRPLPSVLPGPPAQPRPDWEEFERDVKPTSDAEIPDLLRNYRREDSRFTLWIPPALIGVHPRNRGGIDLNGEAEQMSDLTAPGSGRTVVTQPLDCSRAKWGVINTSYGPPSADHANHPRCKDSRTIANAHLSAAANPQEEQKQDLIRRPAQPPPPLPSERDPPRRPAQPPPPLPSERDPRRRPAQPPPPLQPPPQLPAPC